MIYGPLLQPRLMDLTNHAETSPLADLENFGWNQPLFEKLLGSHTNFTPALERCAFLFGHLRLTTSLERFTFK